MSIFEENRDEINKEAHDFLRLLMNNTKVKPDLRLRACSELLERTAPKVRNVSAEQSKPITIVYVSALDAARARLAELPEGVIDGTAKDLDTDS